MHHMYLQAMKETTQQWTQMSYKVTTKEVSPKLKKWYKEIKKGTHDQSQNPEEERTSPADRQDPLDEEEE